MAATRKEHNRRQTVRDIESAFLSEYRRHGIDGVSIATICGVCGISRSTFYLYYDSKYAVLQDVEARLISELDVICCNFPLMLGTLDTVQVAEKIVRNLRENIDWYRAILGDKGDPSFVFHWKKTIMESLHQKLLRNGLPECEASVREVLFSSAMIGLYTYIVHERPDISNEELSRHMDDLLGHLLSP